MEKPMMPNPISSELIAHEQHKDRLRQAEQRRLVEAVIARRPAARFDPLAALGNLLIAVRQLFNAPACAD
jgi:hypothetical protein